MERKLETEGHKYENLLTLDENSVFLFLNWCDGELSLTTRNYKSMRVGENAYLGIFYAVRGTNNQVIYVVHRERALLKNVVQ